jgi:hypothetical protein
MDIVGLTDLASDIGALGISIIVIWGLLTERLIPRGRLLEMRQRCEDCDHELEVERARHEHLDQ